MSIEEGNKLIAEFMGWEYNDDTTVFENGSWSNGDGTLAVDLVFDSDWNDLMAVVEKIESMGFESDISSEATYFKMETSPFDVVAQAKNSWRKKIETVWEACVQFIQWYNTQSKTVTNG